MVRYDTTPRDTVTQVATVTVTVTGGPSPPRPSVRYLLHAVPPPSLPPASDPYIPLPKYIFGNEVIRFMKGQPLVVLDLNAGGLKGPGRLAQCVAACVRAGGDVVCLQEHGLHEEDEAYLASECARHGYLVEAAFCPGGVLL